MMPAVSFHVIARVLVLLLIISISNRVAAQGKTDSAVARKVQLKIGAQLYKKYACISCHGKTGRLEGDLTHAFQKYNKAEIAGYISNPRRYENTKMPVYEGIVAEGDMAPLVAYIISLGESYDRKRSQKGDGN